MPTTAALLQSANVLLVTSGDLEPDAFDAALAAWLGDSADKAERIAAFRAASVSRAALHKEQEAAHAAIRKRHEAAAERCGHLMTALLVTRRELGEEPKIPGIARLQRNGGKPPLIGLDAVDTATLPDSVCKVERKAVSDLVRAAILSGVDIPGVYIGEAGEGVRWE